MTNSGSNGKSLLSINELQQYIGLGKNRAFEFGKRVGALKKIGRRSLYDKSVIDRALNRIGRDEK